jgi:hypothetical protein
VSGAERERKDRRNADKNNNGGEEWSQKIEGKREKKAENDRTGREGQTKLEIGDSIKRGIAKWGWREREGPNGQRKDWRNANKTRK